LQIAVKELAIKKVEIDVLNKIAAEVVLFSDENVFTNFPNSDIASVSVTLLKGK
jgi:hypothetical protein